jgi:deaminated glutathione amidase
VRTLRVALAQILSGSDPQENLELVATYAAEAAAQGAQLVIFPEATMRRFGLPLAEIAEPVDGGWAQQLGKIAEHHQLVIIAGMFTPGEDGRIHNTLRAVGPDVDAYYNKIHLFDAFGFRESDTVAPGTEPVMITVGETKVGLTTCYDVRFPGLYMALAEQGGSWRWQDRAVAAVDAGSSTRQHGVRSSCGPGRSGSGWSRPRRYGAHRSRL